MTRAKNGLVRARDVIFGNEWKLTGEQFIDLLERVPLYNQEGNPFKFDLDFTKRPLGPLPSLVTSALGKHQAEDLRQWIKDQDDREMLLLQARDYAYLLRVDIERFLLNPAGIETPVSHSIKAPQKPVRREYVRSEGALLKQAHPKWTHREIAAELARRKPLEGVSIGTIRNDLKRVGNIGQRGRPTVKK